MTGSFESQLQSELESWRSEMTHYVKHWNKISTANLQCIDQLCKCVKKHLDPTVFKLF